MKILIIAIPRSGSTVLTNSISTLLNCDDYHEPYNPKHPIKSHDVFIKNLPINVVVKTMIHHVPFDNISSIDFYENEIKHYDKVILLSRKDILSSYESFNHNINENFNGNWHQPYTYKERKLDLNLYNSYLKWTSTIIDYSLFTNIPITWYEDLYNIDSSITKNIIDSWQLNDDVNIILPNFDIKNKYRKSNDILI
jgi:hypothetical protein